MHTQWQSRIRGKWKYPVCLLYQHHRSSRKKTAASGVKKRSHYGSPWNFQFNPTCGWHQQRKTTSLVKWLHHYGVEGTTACQGSSWIHSIRRHSSNNSLHHHGWQTGWRRIWNTSERIGWRWKGSYRIDQGELMIKASTKELSFSIHYKSWSSIYSNNKFQVFPKPATV